MRKESDLEKTSNAWRYPLSIYRWWPKSRKKSPLFYWDSKTVVPKFWERVNKLYIWSCFEVQILVATNSYRFKVPQPKRQCCPSRYLVTSTVFEDEKSPLLFSVSPISGSCRKVIVCNFLKSFDWITSMLLHCRSVPAQPLTKTNLGPYFHFGCCIFPLSWNIAVVCIHQHQPLIFLCQLIKTRYVPLRTGFLFSHLSCKFSLRCSKVFFIYGTS